MLHAPDRRRQAAATRLLLLMLALALALPSGPALASRRDDIAAAEAAALAGRHAEAARLYESASERRFFGTDRSVALLAAREYLAAGQVDDADRMADEASGRFRDDEAILYAQIRAQIALARRDPNTALATLDQAPEPRPPAVEAEFAELRRQAEAMLRPPPAVVSPLPAAPQPESVMGMSREELLPQASVERVALLLPLSGRLGAAGAAIREGFIAGWYGEYADYRPEIAIYDTAKSGVSAAFEQALAEQAQFVVGPLTKDDVATLAVRDDIYVPVLALNSYAGPSPPPFLYRFSLDPEEEARAVARRIAADGHLRGIALFPGGEWGERVFEAFNAEAAAAGLVILSAQPFDPGATDFSGPLRAALGRFAGAGDRKDGKPAPKRDSVAEARDGPQFAFVAASAPVARAIKPQLRFQMSYVLPVYSTSDAWEPGASGVRDMNGLTFPELPWILYDGQGAPGLWDLARGDWARQSRGLLRLYAFGFDAFQLMRSLRGSARTFGLAGLTGTLDIDASGAVHRQLEFARVVDGEAEPAGTAIFIPASEP
jgi:outer membrane PBP1 activator LpoA protein